MRKLTLYILFGLVLLPGCVSRPQVRTTPVAEKRPVSASVSQPADSMIEVERPVSEKTIYREVYRFRIDWMRIPVGYVTFEIMHDKVLNGKKVFRVTLRVRTNRFASRIYRIEDRYTSYVDKETLLPIRLDVDRREGRYRKKAVTVYDRVNRMAYFRNFHDGSSKSYPIPEDVLDPISCVIMMRSRPLEVGRDYVLNVDTSEVLYKIYAYIEKKEIINVKGFGDFMAAYVSPYALLNGKKVRKGTISGYISDKEGILLYAEARAALFTKMTANLIRMKRYRRELP
jgi:hypothetical protein